MDNSTKLKEFRNAKGMTQQELATNSNISIRTIQRIEKGLSKGSSYSLKELAKILEIGNWKLLLDESNSLDVPEIDKIIKKFDVRLMNLSSLAIVVIPLSNFILPLILYIRAKGKVDEDAKKILSFQLLWSFFTILLMLLMPFLLLIVFDLAKPEIIFILVTSYLLLVAINIFFVLKTARRLNLKKEILTFVPKII